MKKSIYIILSLFILPLFSNMNFLLAQEVTTHDSIMTFKKVIKYGKVRVQAAIVHESSDVLKASLICGKDTLTEDYKNSNFFFWNKVPVGIARVNVWADGFITDSDTINVREGQTSQKNFFLTDRVIQLKAVTVKGKIPAMVYRGDTIRFNPKGINILEDDVARNILEQMPGVEVSEQSVKVAGKEVEKTYVDGKKIFGENPMDALNHLSANDVVYISAYDEDEHKEQTQKNRRGKKRRVLNIETKSKLVNSKEGNLITSIGGNMEKQLLADHDIRYGIGGTFNFFSEKMLVAINTMHNNLNWANNQPQIFLNTKSPPQTYSENTFGGIDLSRRWEKETGFYKEIKGGYKFARTALEANTRTLQEYFATDAFQQKSYLSQHRNINRHNKHTMNAGFDMNDKQWGTLAINYTLSTDNARQQTLQLINNSIDKVESIGTLQQKNKGRSKDMQGSINWNKYFGNWQYSVGTSYSNNSLKEEENRMNETKNEISGSLQEIISIPSDREGDKWEGNTEIRRMLSKEKYTFIGLAYKFVADNRHINQIAWNKVTGEADLSNTYSYSNLLIEHTPQINAVFPNLGIIYLDFSAGWNYSILKDRKKTSHSNYEKTFSAFTGEILLNLGSELSKKAGHSLKYTINTVLPNITQLRVEIQNSNPYFISSGNPNLKASTVHKILWKEQYRFNDYGHWINSELTLNFIQNSISNKNTYFSEATYLPDFKYTTIANSTLSNFENLNGAWSGDWRLSWLYPVNKIKSNFNTFFDSSYMHIPYYFDNRRDVSRITTISTGINLSTNLIPRLRYSTSWMIRYQYADNKKNNQTNKILTNRLGINISCTPILKYLFANISYVYLLQNNKSNHQVEKENILNIHAGAKLFKRRGELSLTAFDILDSFRNNTILMKDNYTSYTERENLGRYFTINFAWKFRQIKSNRMDVSRGVSW